ncbi:hypothetical protein OG698_00440 [Streptomyces sp. NBC_01003]|uniref:hypothetical protein n=1 Tax=Streptomyces sp. NBC_01003 TaxID=2903714 RepID=UPI003868EF7D|nr:hypothetical protein OG698_00440 [Streptomyces sp. NBC_01003]
MKITIYSWSTKPIRPEQQIQRTLPPMRNAASQRLATADILSDDTLLSVPLRAGELAALKRLADFVDMSDELRGIASSLLADLKARAVTATDDAMETAASLHRTARTEAERLRDKQR